MGFSIDKIKQEFARNRKRAAILGVLSLVLVGFAVKAYFDMAPRNAAAAGAAEANPTSPSTDEAMPTAAESDAQIRQSKELWNTLRTKRGIAPAAAFTFGAAYYPLDPNRTPSASKSNGNDTTPHLVTTNVSNQEADRVAKIKEQAGKLIVTSTVVGSGNSRPVAVISGKIVTVGDWISGFQVMAIKAREVEFKMDGVTLVATMADSANNAETHGP